MAIVHIDLVNGNDANDGSTWALAKKTIPISGSDEIRIAKSPDAVSTGVNATLTKFSNSIVLATPLTKTIDTAVGNSWTMSANVTGGTYNTYRRYGASCQQFSILAAFTTGKIAYKTMALTDFSAYTKISLWLSINSIANAVNTQLRLCLCSDTVGNVVVNSIPITVINTQLNYQFPIVEDYGSALGSNIQSVAIYCDVDVTALTIRVNNIEAVNNVHHKTLIGISSLNGSRWYGIESIVGDTITILQGYTVISTPRGYSEETGEYTLYYRTPIIYTTSNNTAVSSNMQLLFGWNTVSNEMDGETWLDYLIQYNTYSYNLNGTLTIKNLGLFRTGKALLASSAVSLTLQNISAVNCIPLNGSVVSLKNVAVDGLNVLNCTGYADYNIVEIGEAVSCKNICVANNADAAANYQGSLIIQGLATKYENIIVANNYNGLVVEGHGNHLKNVVIQHNYTTDIKVIGGETVFDNLEFVDKGSASVNLGSNTVVKNSIELALQYPWTTAFGTLFHKVREFNVIDNPTLNKVWISAKVVAIWQTDVKRAEDVGAWRFDMTSADAFNGSQDIRPAVTYTEIAVEQDVEITISVWVYQQSAGNNEIVIRPEMCDVVSEKISVALPVTGTDIWQLIPITLTPIKSGILVLEILYKGTNLYVGSVVL